MSIKTKKTPWGDCVDTIKYSLPLDNWYNNKTPKLPYNYFRLPDCYSFNLTEMQNEISKICEQYQPISVSRNSNGDRFTRYRGLGFYSKRNSTHPLEDHFIRTEKDIGIVYPDDLHLNKNLPNLLENDFTETTDIMTNYIKNVFSVFKSNITKASILELRPLGWLGSHVDYPYYKTIRLHASIFGNENAWYEVDGEQFQIPQDGAWYFIDTGKYHSIWNYGPSSRITLNVNLQIFQDPKILVANNLL